MAAVATYSRAQGVLHLAVDAQAFPLARIGCTRKDKWLSHRPPSHAMECSIVCEIFSTQRAALPSTLWLSRWYLDTYNEHRLGLIGLDPRLNARTCTGRGWKCQAWNSK